MPTITPPASPIGVLDNALFTVEYTQDQAPLFSELRFGIGENLVMAGDYITINGTPWVNTLFINSPTNWSDAESFVRQFNSNPDFNLKYTAEIYSSNINFDNIRIKAIEPTSTLDITATVNSNDVNGIFIIVNNGGQAGFSKNDIANFAQLARIKGSNNNNQQVNSGGLYYFEISDQLRGRLTEFYLPSATGQLFLNSGMASVIDVEFGTRFTENGSTYQQRVYTDTETVSVYRGKQTTAGLLTSRVGAKTTNTNLWEACSWLLYDYVTVTSLRRKVEITYTDLTTDTVLDGSLLNPQFGIVTALAGAYTFATDPAKTVSRWTVSLAQPDGTIIYEGQTYLNLINDCTNTVQVVFTNLYGGIETFTFKDKEQRQFTTSDVLAREAGLPNTYTEFNIVTDETDTQILNEQSVRKEDYESLQGLVKSKYLFIADGSELTPVRRTSYNLTTENFACNFKALTNA